MRPRPVAIMREPAQSYHGKFDNGIVDWATALDQHQALQRIYRRHGYRVELLPPCLKYDCSVFMQDAAFVHGEQAILLNLLSAWRTKEARHNDWELESVLSKFFSVKRLGLPALIDGGEFVVTDEEILVGVPVKASLDAVAQIRSKMDLDRPLRTWTPRVDHIPYVHLGSEMSYIGDGWLLVTEQFSKIAPAQRYDNYIVGQGEEDAANAVRLHDGTLIVQDNCPEIVSMLREDGWEVETADISEFNKGHGHLSCLSINFVV